MCTWADLLGTGLFGVQVGFENGDSSRLRVATSFQSSPFEDPGAVLFFYVPLPSTRAKDFPYSRMVDQTAKFSTFLHMHLAAGNPEQHNSPRIYNRQGHILGKLAVPSNQACAQLIVAQDCAHVF